MRKFIMLTQVICLLATALSYGQAKLDPDSTKASGSKTLPNVQWSRKLVNGKAVYYLYDADLNKTYPFYTAQYANSVLLGKLEATTQFQPRLGYSAASSTGSNAVGVWPISIMGNAMSLNGHSDNYYYPASNPAGYISSSGSFNNPNWLNSLAYSKITGVPTALSQFTNDAGFYKSGESPNFQSITSDRLNVNQITLNDRSTIFAAEQGGGLAGVWGLSLYDPGVEMYFGNYLDGAGATKIYGSNIVFSTPGAYPTDIGRVSEAGISSKAFIKNGGTATQYLMADGSVTTGSPANPITESDPTVPAYVKTLNNFNSIKSSTDALYPALSGSYANPSWITSIPYSKLTGAPGMPTSLSQLANDAGFLTSSALSGYQPLENQRLSTGNNPVFNSLTLGGALGIGTANPQANLDLIGTLLVGGGYPANLGQHPDLSYLKNTGKLLIGWNRSNFQGETDFISNRGVDGQTGGFAFYDYDNSGTQTDLLKIDGGGNIGIGYPNPGYKLDVNGTIHAEEVLVNRIGFPDYVFDPEYVLPSLKEVKTFISENHHLPDMPSANEVVTNGLKIGEAANILTKKVEELTLYLIEKDKELTDLKTVQTSIQAKQQAQISILKKELELLISRRKL